MSFSKKDWILYRIKTAEPMSPIAVFHGDSDGEYKKNKFDACFAATALGSKRVKDGFDLIGVFHKYDLKLANELISKELKSAA